MEPYFCASLTAALKAGKPVHANTTATLADGLAVPTVRTKVFFKYSCAFFLVLLQYTCVILESAEFL